MEADDSYLGECCGLPPCPIEMWSIVTVHPSGAPPSRETQTHSNQAPPGSVVVLGRAAKPRLATAQRAGGVRLKDGRSRGMGAGSPSRILKNPSRDRSETVWVLPVAGQ